MITDSLEPLLREAAAIAVELRRGLLVEQKKDSSLVTNVDRAIEQFLKPRLLEMTPGAGFFGEEYGHTAGTEAGYWVVDPVDGTSNFAFGQPLWGITAAFLRNGVIESGAIFLPELGEMYLASLGGGAFLNGERLADIPGGAIAETELLGNTDSQIHFLGQTPGKMRHIGSFVVESAFVATQRYRALMTGSIRLYDCAAGILLCREAGAEVRYLTGEVFDESRHMGVEPCDPFYMGPRESNFPFGELK